MIDGTLPPMSSAGAQSDASIGDLTNNAPPLWRNVSFHLLWTSTFASGVGDRLIMNAALTILGYGEAGKDNSSLQSGIDFWFFLPYVVWSPVAGWLADRVPRKWLMFAADELRGVIVLVAFGLFALPVMRAGGSITAIGDEHQWKVWVTMFAIGVMAATFVPAKLSIVPNVVGLRYLQRANSAVVSMGVIGNLAGFLVAALLGERAVAGMLIASALFYMVSGTFWVFIKTPWQAVRVAGHGELEAVGGSLLDVLRQMWQGAVYAWRHKHVRILIITAALVWGGTSIYMPALGVMNVEVYGGTEPKLFILLFMVGLGMLIGAVLMGMMNVRRGAELLMVAGLIGTGVFIGLQMIVPYYGAGLGIAGLTGVFSSVLLIPLYTLLQRITADHIRGRVFAAKEILTELPKVAIAGVLWKVKGTDPWMWWLAMGLSVTLLGAAGYGIVRYVIVGPHHSKYLNFMWRLARLLCDAVHRQRVVGRHRIPSRAAGLIVCNHTNGVDPMLMQSCMLRVARWMMAKEYMIGLLGRFWRRMRPIPVDRASRDSAALREAIRALQDDGELVGIFPEGGIHDDPATLGRFVPGVGVIAGKTEAPIIPVFITGTPRGGSPFLSYLRPSRAVVVIGAPFRLDPELDRKDRAEEIRRRIEALRPIAEGMK